MTTKVGRVSPVRPGESVEVVPIEGLRFGLSPRSERCDPAHVAALAEVLDRVPPIVVHSDTMRVVDGAHRVRAAQSMGRATIRAVMFEGDESAARIEAVRANVSHGRPLTLKERQSAAARFIDLVPDWSDRRIGEATGLSPKTVACLRDRATVESTQLRVRVGRDGKLRPVDPSESRKRIAEALEADPAASVRAIARRTGASQATVRDVRDRLRRGAAIVPSRQGSPPSHAPPSHAPPSHPPSSSPPAPATLPAPEPSRPRPRAVALPRADAEAPPDGEDGGDGLAAFGDWIEARRLDDEDWRSFLAVIPLSRVYEVADACRRYSESWRAFATALEDRARTHRRSSGTTPVGRREAG